MIIKYYFQTLKITLKKTTDKTKRERICNKKNLPPPEAADLTQYGSAAARRRQNTFILMSIQLKPNWINCIFWPLRYTTFYPSNLIFITGSFFETFTSFCTLDNFSILIKITKTNILLEKYRLYYIKYIIMCTAC